MNKSTVTAIGFLTASLGGLFNAEVSAQGAPNVILIIADDAGYADFGFMDGLSGTTSVVPTPNLDALADRGVRFARAYVGQSCQPTRAALVTGGYQNRIGNEVVGNNLTSATGVFEGVPVESITIWERMKSVGYTTCAVGKWHLGEIEDTSPTQPGNRPQNQGVDEFYGIWHGSRSYNVGGATDETEVIREAIVHPGGSKTDIVVEAAHAGEYITNTFGQYAVDFIADHYNDAAPFFLYQSFTAPHTPMNNSPDFNDPRLAGLSGIQKQYASMVLTMDNEIGRIVGRLNDPNNDEDDSDSIADNTLIIFINDNGGADAGSSSPNGSDNGVLRRGKGTPWEGGIRVPMIIAGAGVDPSVEGTTYNSPVHGVDILPTVFAAGGGVLGAGDTGIDGVDILPYVNGVETGDPHEVLINRHRTQFSVIKGDWKLVWSGGAPGLNPQLYNLATDITESSNVAGANPSLVAELKRHLTDAEAEFDKQRYAILGNTAEATINLFDHFVFKPTVPQEGESVVIDGIVGDGDFQAPGTGSGVLPFSSHPNWFNLTGAETAGFSDTSQMVGSSQSGSRGGVPIDNVVQANSSPHMISSAGEVFNISYDFGAGGALANWEGLETMRVFLFTSSTGVVDGTTVVGNITEIAADEYAIDRAGDGQWTIRNMPAFHTSTAADIGKKVFLGMEFVDAGTGAALSPRIDLVRLTVDNTTGSGESTTSWLDGGAWIEAGTNNIETMFYSDAFTGAVLEFPTTDTFSYTSNNDMVRLSGLEFMLNRMVLSGSFNGGADQLCTIQGNELLFSDSLTGVGPEIAIDAVNGGGSGFSYDINADLVIYDDLAITGNGDVAVTVNGEIRNYFEARGLSKSGTSTAVLAGSCSFSGDTTVSGGVLSLGQANTNNESSSVHLAASGAVLDLDFTGTDTVGELFVGGVQRLAGVYEAMANPGGGIELDQLTGAGTLTVSNDPIGYAYWSAVNAPGQAFDGDHDGDGVMNGIEYFLGETGNSFTALPGIDANGEITWDIGDDYLGEYGIDFVVESSSPDLDSWLPVPVGSVTLVPGVSLSYLLPTIEDALFVRLRIQVD